MPHFRPIPSVNSIQKKTRNLPHWQVSGCTYFITFRLADSIPKSAILKWRREQQNFLRHFDVKAPDELPARHQEQYRSLFGKPFHQTLDQCHGSCSLREPENSKIVADALQFFNDERYHLGDYVVMPNHVHLLVEPLEDLEKLLHSWKSFTAKAINRLLDQTGQFWQEESYDHLVRTSHDLERIINYIAGNPAKANLSPQACRSNQATWTLGTKT